ncbi:MAG: hypothetical protein ACO1N6_00270 [Microcella sp.]
MNNPELVIPAKSTRASFPKILAGVMAIGAMTMTSFVPANGMVAAPLEPGPVDFDSKIEDVAADVVVLDPSTFSGEVIIATTAGEVVTYVEAGELEKVASAIRDEIAGGASLEEVSAAVSLERGAVVQNSCLSWKNAVAGPGVWWTSAPGCSVFGYPGYRRIYNYSNSSSVGACYRGLGHNGTSTQYYTAGCVGAGGSTSQSTAWGNVLMSTRTQGSSLGGSGSAYQWQY